MLDYFLYIIAIVCEILSVIIVVRAIMSWFVARPNTLSLLLDRITEPILGPLRRILPHAGPFDFSPFVAIVLLQLIRYIAIRVG